MKTLLVLGGLAAVGVMAVKASQARAEASKKEATIDISEPRQGLAFLGARTTVASPAPSPWPQPSPRPVTVHRRQ